MEIRVEELTSYKEKPDVKSLGFGKYFTDRMFIVDYDHENGWHDARIVPFGNISLSPACTVFHYGAEIFEGLKAYRRADGTVSLFRPMENIRRLNRSAQRIALPTLDEDFAYEALLKFVELEQDWVPDAPGTSLYLRPFMFGCDPALGVHSINKSTFIIIASPVGSYYAEGLAPVKIMIEDEDVRAVIGGTGEAKCGGNYAAANRAGLKAEQSGYSQVLWLDGVHRKYIEEVGAMNVMFMIGDEIVTPALVGSILPGITRKSCIELLKSKGYKVSERRLSVDELGEALEKGTLKEAWGCGTAAVVSPIGVLKYKDKVYTVNNNEIGSVTQMLYDTLTGIQWGKIEDTFNWTVKIPKK